MHYKKNIENMDNQSTQLNAGDFYVRRFKNELYLTGVMILRGQNGHLEIYRNMILMKNMESLDEHVGRFLKDTNDIVPKRSMLLHG